MSMVEVGRSLDPSTTLEAKSRKSRASRDLTRICVGCKLPPYPRGYCINLGTCWYCTFKRS